jgi:hypothetical protein
MIFSLLADAWGRATVRDRVIRQAFSGLCWAGVALCLGGEPAAEASPAKPIRRSVRRGAGSSKRAKPTPAKPGAAPSTAVPTAASRGRGKLAGPTAPAAPPASAATARVEADFEPPPAGEIAVQWASPLPGQSNIKVRAYPSHGSPALGDMRAGTAIALKLEAPTRGGAGCRGWLTVRPDGYVCADQVRVQPGYLSSPPAQERANGWQRMRYGVVRADSAVLAQKPGDARTALVREAGYLRGVLRRGDGITIVRERDEHVQIWSRQWLRRTDVTVSMPSPLVPINVQALPVGQRMMLAWVVPPAGETQSRLYLPGGTPSVFLPRYTPIYCSEVRPGPAGHPELARAIVHLSEDARALLAGKPEAQGAAFEIDASQLRRLTPATAPSGVGADEHWIDISLSEQVAVAYQGETPLFAALVSTGAHGATPPGTFWVYRKYLSQTMANMRGAASQYDYREVPHAQFFNGRIGLHAVLWHDMLGHPVSHGCVNMSPATAEQFFSFTKPELPAGWHTVNGDPPGRGALWLRGTRIVVRK